MSDERGRKGRTLEDWKARYHAVGHAQGRYLWVLLVTGVFYAVLALQYGDPVSATSNSLPIIGIEVSSIGALLTAPLVISILLIAIGGTHRAVQEATDAIVEKSGQEPTDPHPNVIDMAVFTDDDTEPWIQAVVRMSYPIVETIFLLEAALIAWVNGIPLNIDALTACLLIAGWLAVPFAVRSVWRITKEKFRRAREEYFADRGKESESGVTDSEPG